MKGQSPPRAVARIDTAALIHNYRTLSDYAAEKAAQGPRVIAIVKANAYGHDIGIATKAFLQAGCDFFGVAALDEALRVRKLAPSADILVLGYTPPHLAGALARWGITQTVFSADYATALGEAATASGVTIPVHIKIDCGMHRLGFAPEGENDILSAAMKKGLHPTGIYTHFPVADSDTAATKRSLAAFLACKRRLAQSLAPLFTHAAASAALLTLPESVLDGVRPGLALYGIPPVPTALPLQPALALFSHIVQIHNLPKDTPVGYGGDFITKAPARIGTVPLGYGDGIPRRFSGQTVRVFHQNKLFSAPVIGRICMDQMMLDLTATPATVGDAVQIFEDIPKTAKALDTIPYEVLTALGPRIKRRTLTNKGE